MFKDWNGTVLKTYNIGNRYEVTHDTGFYFVTSWGGIYHDEAKIVNE